MYLGSFNFFLACRRNVVLFGFVFCLLVLSLFCFETSFLMLLLHFEFHFCKYSKTLHHQYLQPLPGKGLLVYSRNLVTVSRC